MHLALDAVVTGIAIGAVYGMIAVGYTVVYQATRVFNLAQGDLVMVSVMLSYVFLDLYRWPVLAALAASTAAVVAISVVEERTIVRPFLRRRSGGIGWFIATLAFSLLLETVAADLYGDHEPRAIPSPLGNRALHLGPVVVPLQLAVVFGALVVVVVGLEVFYQRTWTGQAMRATAEDREAASLLGVEPNRVSLVAFALGGLVAGLAGFVVAPVVFADVTIGLTYSIKGFVALAIGGFGSIRGAVVGALVLGVAEQLYDLYLGSRLDILAALALLAIVLLVRPTGLFGAAAAREV
jgi:branched-chain amino acid transport system permease protein